MAFQNALQIKSIYLNFIWHTVQAVPFSPGYSVLLEPFPQINFSIPPHALRPLNNVSRLSSVGSSFITLYTATLSFRASFHASISVKCVIGPYLIALPSILCSIFSFLISLPSILLSLSSILFPIFSLLISLPSFLYSLPSFLSPLSSILYSISSFLYSDFYMPHQQLSSQSHSQS